MIRAPSGMPSPPISPYGTLTGDLFLYAGGIAAFESPSASRSSKKCILLGGLSDGLLPVPYTVPLEQCCIQNEFSLVQPILSSSYTGFGHGNLDRDCDEIQKLMDYLQAHRTPDGEECRFCLIGHSTGCQDIVHFLKQAPDQYREKVIAFVLQAPVSDREHAQVNEPESYAKFLALGQEMKRNGKGEEMMPRLAFWAPITANRFLDLQERGGTDDYFSSDYSDEELHERLGHCCGFNEEASRLGIVVFSGADEYVPRNIDSDELSKRLALAMNFKALNAKSSPCVTSICIPDANHNLSQPESAVDDFIRIIADLFHRMN